MDRDRKLYAAARARVSEIRHEPCYIRHVLGWGVWGKTFRITLKSGPQYTFLVSELEEQDDDRTD